MERACDFEQRRKHLADLNERELEERFWKLCENLMEPIVDLASTHTSPSIERSVLLRMGFSSLESRSIVEEAINRNLLGHGAGHLVYKLSIDRGLGIREAGLELISGESWDHVVRLFKGGK